MLRRLIGTAVYPILNLNNLNPAQRSGQIASPAARTRALANLDRICFIGKRYLFLIGIVLTFHTLQI